MNQPVVYHLGKFPPSRLDWERLIPLIGPANAAVARYDGLLSAIVLEVEAGGEPAGLTEPRRGDIFEIINYRAAMEECVEELKKRRLSQHLLRQAHQKLMRGVRGRTKTPGSYRTDQNWIGPHGCKKEEAEFVPTAPEHLQTGMDTWETFPT